MTVTLRIFVYGLLTFVVDSPASTPQMTVLMVDARNPPVAADGCHIHSHTPAIIFQGPRCDYPCFREGGFCRCNLDRMKVVIPQPAPRPRRPLGLFGGEKVDKKAMKFVPNMPGEGMRFKRRVRQECYPFDRTTSQGTADRRLCQFVGAYSRFRLARRIHDCEQAHHGYELRFRPLLGYGSYPDYRCAAAEVMLAPVEAKAVQQGSEWVVQVELIAFDGSESYSIEVPVKDLADCGRPRNGNRDVDVEGERPNYCAEIVLANARDLGPARPIYARCRDPRIVREFELLHELMENPDWVHKRAVPHVEQAQVLDPIETGRCPDSDLVDDFLDRLRRSGEGKPICSPAEGAAP